MATRREHNIIGSADYVAPSRDNWQNIPTYPGQDTQWSVPAPPEPGTSITGQQANIWGVGNTDALVGKGGGSLVQTGTLGDLDGDRMINDIIRGTGTHQVKPDTPENQQALAQAFPQGGGGTKSVALGGASTGGSSTLYPTSKKTVTEGTTTWEPAGPMPTLAEGTPYQAPEYDEQRVRQLSQRIAAPALMRLRRDMMTTIAQSGNYFGNPLARAEATRRALRAYGLGVAETLGQAEQAGRAQYSTEYNAATQEAQLNFNQQNADRLTQFNAAMQDYAKRGTTKTSSTGTTTTQYANRSQAITPTQSYSPYGGSGTSSAYQRVMADLAIPGGRRSM